MRLSILHPANAEVLVQAAAGSLLLAFDFDGTLAPIVRRPADAAMTPATRRLLEHLTTLYPTVVISGRALADLSPRLQGLNLVGMAGNHGRELPDQVSTGQPMVEEWARVLGSALASEPGVMIEHKGASLSVHWRGAQQTGVTRRRVMAAIAELQPPPRVIGGKAVANLVADDGIDKGSALRFWLQASKSATALYLGDDDTDEDGFRLGPPAGVIGIRVGRSRTSCARYRLASQCQVDILLRTLIALRRTTGSRPNSQTSGDHVRFQRTA